MAARMAIDVALKIEVLAAAAVDLRFITSLLEEFHTKITGSRLEHLLFPVCL
jgi:hypothetical protein